MLGTYPSEFTYPSDFTYPSEGVSDEDIWTEPFDEPEPEGD